jgi:hypothetical protein
MQKLCRAALGVLLVLPLAAQAQVPSFHNGQWGAEVGLGSGNNATLLRFTSPSQAWLISFDAAVASIDNKPAGGTSVNQTNWNVALRLGQRRYSSGAGGVLPFHSIGLLTSYNQAHAANTTNRLWNAGVFFDLGASWLFNSHVGLGGSGEVDAAYNSATTETTLVGGGTQKSTAKGFSLAVGRLRVLASVYF